MTEIDGAVYDDGELWEKGFMFLLGCSMAMLLIAFAAIWPTIMAKLLVGVVFFVGTVIGIVYGPYYCGLLLVKFRANYDDWLR